MLPNFQPFALLFPGEPTPCRWMLNHPASNFNEIPSVPFRSEAVLSEAVLSEAVLSEAVLVLERRRKAKIDRTGMTEFKP